MRIARVLTRLNLGGPARQVLASDPVLRDRGHEVCVFTGSSEVGEGSLEDELRAASIEVVAVPGLSRSWRGALTGGDRRARAFLEEQLRSFDPDIVHTHASKAGAIGRPAARRACPRAKTVHTFHGHVLEGYFPAPVSWALQRVEGRLARQTDRIVAVSEATRDDLVRFGIGRSDEIAVSPPGAVLEPFLSLPRDRSRTPLRLAESIPAEAMVIGVIGRLAPVKRPTMALEVFAALAREFPDAHLVFAGDGEERSELERDLGGLEPSIRDRVHLLGAVRDIVPVHEALDVLLSTSFSEGMPVAMIEAAASARPVVTTAVGGIPELVISGVTGLFGIDVAGLAAAVGGLLSRPEERIRLGDNARKRANLTYGRDALANRLEGIYATLLASPA